MLCCIVFTLSSMSKLNIYVIFTRFVRTSVCPEQRCHYNFLRIPAIGLTFDGMMNSAMKQIAMLSQICVFHETLNFSMIFLNQVRGTTFFSFGLEFGGMMPSTMKQIAILKRNMLGYFRAFRGNFPT